MIVLYSDARVMIITPAPVEDDVVEYYLRDAAGFRDAELPAVRERLEVVWPRATDRLALDTMLLEDTALLVRLRKLARGSGPARLVNFAASPETDAISAELGIPAEQHPQDGTRLWGSKHGGKEILRLSKVPTPAGPVNPVFSARAVLAACRQFDAGTGRLAVKLDDQKWGAAVGTLILDRGEVLAALDVPAGIVRGEQPWPDFQAEMGVGGAIVEEYLPNVVASPSSSAFIDLDGHVHVVSTQDQLLDGDRYIGCVGPAARFTEEIGAHLTAVGGALAGMGVRGHFGIDFIVLTDDTLTAVEINLRKVGTSHVVAHVHGVLTGSARKANPEGQFVHRRILQPEVLGGMTRRTVIESLREQGVLFDHETGTGVLLHMLGAISACGYLETTCVSTSRAEAFDLDRDVHEVLGLRLPDRIRFATVG